jgi:hypothetical protein
MLNAKAMLRRIAVPLLGALPMLLLAGVVSAQYPLLDRAANKVTQKYQNSSCEQLWQERGQPKSQREQGAVNFLRSDPQMRRMFIDRVAPTVANKMFECGMIPTLRTLWEGSIQRHLPDAPNNTSAQPTTFTTAPTRGFSHLTARMAFIIAWCHPRVDSFLHSRVRFLQWGGNVVDKKCFERFRRV